MGSLFLQEVEATLLVADVRDFTALSSKLRAVEIGIALSRFYEHVAALVEANRGRVVKFVGDGVLAAFIGAPGVDHRARALATVHAAEAGRQPFLDENAKLGLPVLDYTLGVASGEVLAGELGTGHKSGYDVVGAAVNQAFRVCALAARRNLGNLVAADTWERVGDAARATRPPGLETDLVEIGAEKLRLFRVDAE